MPLETVRLNIDTPAGQLMPSRGFYQLEEDSLYVQIGPFDVQHRFFSFLEAETVRFDLDKKGELIFIEVSLPRRRWTVDSNLILPAESLPADIRWLDFRQSIIEPKLITNDKHSILCISLSDTPAKTSFNLAQSVIVQTDGENHLHSVWVTDIVDDLAGKEIAAFRKGLAKH
ncbi:MAG: hypothetical protein SGI97_02710 [candidate division Zixibacteria bacterium]|nr:hypothetical protein [candidate division Zixibacteria bacterium]